MFNNYFVSLLPQLKVQEKKFWLKWNKNVQELDDVDVCIKWNDFKHPRANVL